MARLHKCQRCGWHDTETDLCWQCECELKRDEVLNLSKEQIRGQIKTVLKNPKNLSSPDSDEYMIFNTLFSYRGIIMPGITKAALREKIYSEPKLFYHSAPEIRDDLISSLASTSDAKEALKLICCLAMQGDYTALKTLRELEHSSKPWRHKLSANPSDYVRCAGWTFDSNGNKIELDFLQSYVFEKGDRAQKNAAAIAVLNQDRCDNCGCQMIDILKLDGRNSRFAFLGANKPIRVSCCPNCASNSNVTYCRCNDDGRTEILPQSRYTVEENYLQDRDLQEISQNSYTLSDYTVPLFYGTCGNDLNMLGGHAKWVTGHDYKKCPSCGKTMRYLAQIQWPTLSNRLRGTLFIEVCTDCRIFAIIHQER